MLNDVFHYQVIRDNLGYLLCGNLTGGQPGGLLMTLFLALGSGLTAIVLGFPLAIAHWLGPRWLRRALTLAGEIVRGIPLLLLIFWLYFLLPMWLGQLAPDSASIIAALGLFNAVTVMISIRAGLDALPRGQEEAALASGLSRGQALRLVLLPQALSHMLPSFVNLFVALIKDTSLAFIVSIPELTMISSQVNNREQIYPMEIFLFAGLVYFLLCGALSLGATVLERRLRTGLR